MGASTPAVKVTLEEFLDGINDEERYKRCEYWDGEVIPKDPDFSKPDYPMSPVRYHALIQSALAYEIRAFLLQHPLGEVFTELHCRLHTGRVVVPDLAVILGQDDDYTSAHPRAPELAVEILSPSDRIINVTRKVDFYLRHGVKVVWLIYMDSREATIHTPTDDVRLIPETGILTAESVLPGLAIPLVAVLPHKKTVHLSSDVENT